MIKILRTLWLLSCLIACGGAPARDAGLDSGSIGSNVVSSAYNGVITLYRSQGGCGMTACFNQGSLALDVTGSACPGGSECCFEPIGDGLCESAVSAGTLTLTDNGAVLGTMGYSAHQPYLQLALPGTCWAPGDTLAVSAPGATADAFEVETIAAPDLEITAPSASQSTLSLSQDLVVSWNADGSLPEELFSVVVQVDCVGSVTCYPGDGSGSVTIPSTLLQNLGTAESATLYVTRSPQLVGKAANLAVDLIYTSGAAVGPLVTQ